MGSHVSPCLTMIHWLINSPLYSPLSFESGVTSGALSIVVTQAGLYILSFFAPTAPTQASTTIVRCLKTIVQPIRQLEVLLEDPNYRQLTQGIFIFITVLTIGVMILFIKYQQQKRLSTKTGSAKIHKEAKRLLDERKQFIHKVDALEKLNKRYREAVFLAEKSYNEEHRLKRLEEKRLKNLEKYMEQCSKVICKRKQQLNETLDKF